MSKVIDLPIIICGEVVELEEGMDVNTIEYETGVTLRFPKVTEEHLEKIKKFDNKKMADLTVDDILNFLQKIGMHWSSNQYEGKEEAIELSAKVTGYDRYFTERDYLIISEYCVCRGELYDQMEAELGSHFILDEWVPRQDCLIKAFPKGKALHIMVGNIPIASTFTILRGIMTKNQTIAKLSSRDPVSSLMYFLSFIKIAPDHPITRSLSIFFWKGGDEQIEKPVMEMSDVMCVWGGENAVMKIKPKVPFRTEYIEFGPKTSLSIIDLSKVENIDNAAARFASDVSIYNQEACFSPLNAFFIGEITEEFIERATYWLNINAQRWPKGYTTFDDHAHMARTKLEQMYLGNRVVHGEENRWQMIIKKNLERLSYHPLGRSIVMYRVNDISEVYPFVTELTQTISFWPWDLAAENCDKLAELGAERMCELGTHGIFRTGFSHDGIYPLARMVRWVNLERPMKFKGKYMDNEEMTAAVYYGYTEDLVEDKYKKLGVH